ncbi:CoA transferase [Streptomyces sp. TRM66268-LWL]|uniref:CoA transferase n=1 Tax=Streptomyces polyasparticus TaxID=2767826 RepID=A0ABR7SZF3_9ACTN|nr:CoA transferase [Streptomyces polyasparticus]MBC9719648.1 CoA transferase [Streptomyces polyasparticus]
MSTVSPLPPLPKRDISARGPLAGLRVIDLATLFAGPLAATMLGDFGADVIKVEHPREPDPSRGQGPSQGGIDLGWKQIGRNKRTITLDLSAPQGRETFLDLIASADVAVESFRPGTLESWGLGWDELRAVNPRLVLARVTSFGQSGPRAGDTGAGALAETMGGIAATSGEHVGPSAQPPFALADSVAALATAYGVMTALAGRGRTSRGQVVDLAVIEPILAMLGPHSISNEGTVAAPVFDIRDVMADERYRARGTVAEVPDKELGSVRMQNVLFRLSETPGGIRWPGRSHGADTDEVLKEAGVSSDRIRDLRRQGVL